MKRMFIAAMAIAALVSCSKDNEEGVALDSGKKTVAITIANGNDTRTAVNGGAAGVTTGAQGEDGTTFTCETDADDLTIVFADAAGAIQKTLGLTDMTGAIEESGAHGGSYLPETGNGAGGVYTWHNVPWNVTQIAVVRVDPNKDADKTFANISDYSALAINEDENLTRTLDEIVLFGQADLEDTGTTHVVGDVYYHYWDATVTVEPLLARFEINKIQCEDLGSNNPYKADGEGLYSFDKLTIGVPTWTSATGGRSYTIPGVEGVVLHGSYKNTENLPNYVTAATEDNPDAVWSWNVDPELTEFGGMVVPLVAEAYDYTPAEDEVPLTITEIQKDGKKVDFTKGNVYQLDIKFKEEHIMHEDKLCVEITVKIADWTVNTVTPVFGN